MDRPNMELHADARFAIAHAERGGIQVNRASRIMTASTHGAFLNATELLENARQLAGATMAKAQEGYDEACERGYQVGLARARQQALEDQVQHSLQQRENVDRLKTELNDLVLQIVRRLLGEIDCAERAGILVREGLARIAKLQGDIAIHVNPALRDRVAADIAQWQAARPEASMTVLSNADIELDACRIIFPSGCVDGNLRRQLEALEAALSGRGGFGGNGGTDEQSKPGVRHDGLAAC